MTTDKTLDEPSEDEQRLAEDRRHALFVELLSDSRRPLLGYLMSLLGRRHDAEDVLQRASITMWRRFETFEPGSDFLAWASTVAFYEAKNFLRVAGRSRLQFSDELLQTLAAERLADIATTPTRLASLHECLQKLEKPQRQLVQSVYFDDADVATLAASLGRAPQTVYNKLCIIRRRLADCVTQRMLEGGA